MLENYFDFLKVTCVIFDENDNFLIFDFILIEIRNKK